MSRYTGNDHDKAAQEIIKEGDIKEREQKEADRLKKQLKERRN